MALSDKTLTCRECGIEFIFTAGEQEFYQSRGLVNEPGRCPACRAARRSGRRFGEPRESFDITCDSCGCQATVPFRPSQDRPVYCSDCFTKMKAEDS